MWRAGVVTLFPELFPGPLAAGVTGRALGTGLWSLEAVDLRRFGIGARRQVDDTPFGGGPGMVLRPDVIASALAASPAGTRLVFLTPRGRPFVQADAQEWSTEAGLTVLCGRYEGVDQRAVEAAGAEEISIGDFVLSGGETAALVLLDACVRLLPGALGERESLAEESFSAGLLEYEHYTRPALWQGRAVPETLLSGNHAAIAAWRRRSAEEATRLRRADLWARRPRGATPSCSTATTSA